MRALRLERRLAAVVAGALMLILALSAAAPGVAGADVGETIILRCTHHESLAGFKQADYRRALKEMSATTEEYSGCGQEIRQAMEAAATSRSGTSVAAGPVTPVTVTPAERTSLAGAANGGPVPVTLGSGEVVHPGVVHANIGSAFSTLPASLLAVLGCLLAALLAVAVAFVRRRMASGGSFLGRRFGGGAD